MPTTIESVVALSAGRWQRRSAHALADAVARRAVDQAGLAAADIDLLVNAGLYRDRQLGEPALAALIQEDIGANPEDPHPGGHGTFSFDVANGSCGMLTGLHIADGFLRAGTIRHALIVASDSRPGRRLAPGFPFGATGAAIVCGWRPGGHGIQDLRFTAPAGGGAGGPGDVEVRATMVFAGGHHRLEIVEGPDFAAAAADTAAELAAEVLADHGLRPGDVELVGANPLTDAFLDPLAARLGVDRARLAVPAARPAAHTAGLGVALASADATGRLAGATALLVSAGAGPVAGVALLR